MAGRLALLLALWALSPPALPAAGIELVDGRFVVRDAPPDARLLVYVSGADQPMLGAHAREGATLLWTPRYPLSEGLTYRAVLEPAPGLEASFTIPRRANEPARLLAIYPSSPVLPENLLKMYLHFSAPMSRGEAYRRVRLLDARGREVELAILEIEQELWDRSGTRLTLLFDPGRIKRDLLPNKEAGPPLRAGASYTLAVDAAWPDAKGQPLREAAAKTFTVAPADREPPHAGAWTIRRPRAGTREPLVILFPEPMDRALLEQLIAVERGGAALAGEAAIVRDEREWRFTPEATWSASSHDILFDTALEDLAGNRIDRPFDVDLFVRVDRHVSRQQRRLGFEPLP